MNNKQFSEANARILVVNKNILQNKLNKIISDGIENIQVVTDFDWTITQFLTEDGRQKTVYNMFLFDDNISESFKLENQKNFDYYHPIETDQTLSVEEKKMLIEEWYEKAKNNYIKEGINKQKCHDVLNNSKLRVRDSFPEFISKSEQLQLPFYIISGGITELLNPLIESQVQDKNYHQIYSNKFIFAEDGQLIDIETKITSQNKNQILHKDNINFKKNNILFGDLPTDVLMEQNMGVENSIRVAFLDVKKLNLQETYEKMFDILIIGEGSFNFGLYILQKIQKKDISMFQEYEKAIYE